MDVFKAHGIKSEIYKYNKTLQHLIMIIDDKIKHNTNVKLHNNDKRKQN